MIFKKRALNHGSPKNQFNPLSSPGSSVGSASPIDTTGSLSDSFFVVHELERNGTVGILYGYCGNRSDSMLGRGIVAVLSLQLVQSDDGDEIVFYSRASSIKSLIKKRNSSYARGKTHQNLILAFSVERDSDSQSKYQLHR